MDRAIMRGVRLLGGVSNPRSVLVTGDRSLCISTGTALGLFTSPILAANGMIDLLATMGSAAGLLNRLD